MFHRRPAPPASPPTAHMIDQLWCDQFGVYVAGWIHAHARRVEEIALVSGPHRVATRAFIARPDLLAHYPAHGHVAETGFALYLACPPFTPVMLEAVTAAGTFQVAVEMPPHLAAPEELPWDHPRHPWVDFVEAMWACGGTALEIGAREVGTLSAAAATNPFPPRARRLTNDIHPGPGIDVVADVHALSRVVAPGSLDGVYSVSVLEHLAAPWLAAAEMNRVLRIGGYVFHLVPQTLPIHEMPNDFWRMSDRGLAPLFGPHTGFDIITCGMRGPMRVHPSAAMLALGWRDTPTSPGYAESWILARKVAELPAGAVAWPLDATAMAELSRAYPAS